jgi:hypothetical protein
LVAIEFQILFAINKVTIDWDGKEFTLKKTGKKYILRKDNKEVYDYESVMESRQIPARQHILIH